MIDYLQLAYITLGVCLVSVHAAPLPGIDAPTLPPSFNNLLETSKQCEYTTLAPALLPYMVDIQKCNTDTNYTILPPEGLPTRVQLDALCSFPSCNKMFASISNIILPNCTISTRGREMTFESLLQHISKQCETTSPPPVPYASDSMDATVVPVVTSSKKRKSSSPFLLQSALVLILALASFLAMI